MIAKEVAAHKAGEKTAQDTPDAKVSLGAALPPLENGDRLTRFEFERRYNAMPHLKKAELIEGVVYVPSPIRFESHAEPHGQIIAGLAVYCAATSGVSLMVLL